MLIYKEYEYMNCEIPVPVYCCKYSYNKYSVNFRACPECRTKSDFVTPSKYWIEDEKQKEKLIESYKGALRFVTVVACGCEFSETT